MIEMFEYRYGDILQSIDQYSYGFTPIIIWGIFIYCLMVIIQKVNLIIGICYEMKQSNQSIKKYSMTLSKHSIIGLVAISMGWVISKLWQDVKRGDGMIFTFYVISIISSIVIGKEIDSILRLSNGES
ncbi:hypothetical protein DFJ63DRAFT_319184 [Scheffersomyces coipomensis]|uniref:uncharacterized protein n=1 Tax=Scheffersomyces coipomensis TaxID=1788519 RepID=UPI00315D7AD5